jgi:hypothetical protein
MRGVSGEKRLVKAIREFWGYGGRAPERKYDNFLRVQQPHVVQQPCRWQMADARTHTFAHARQHVMNIIYIEVVGKHC